MELLKRVRIALLLRMQRCPVVAGQRLRFGRGTTFNAPNGIEIGHNVFIGKYVSLDTDLDIGNDVLIANLVGFIGRYDHDYSVVGVPMKDAPWIGDADYLGPGRGLKVIVEDDCWIGFNAVLLSGVRVGRGSIVAAGAVVTKDIPPYSIAAGMPARVVGQRFSEDQIVVHEAALAERHRHRQPRPRLPRATGRTGTDPS